MVHKVGMIVADGKGKRPTAKPSLGCSVQGREVDLNTFSFGPPRMARLPASHSGIADTGFIFFVLVPGYTPAWPSILGPVFWALATIFSTIALLTRTKGATRSFTGNNTELKHPQ